MEVEYKLCVWEVYLQGTLQFFNTIIKPLLQMSVITQKKSLLIYLKYTELMTTQNLNKAKTPWLQKLIFKKNKRIYVEASLSSSCSGTD